MSSSPGGPAPCSVQAVVVWRPGAAMAPRRPSLLAARCSPYHAVRKHRPRPVQAVVMWLPGKSMARRRPSPLAARFSPYRTVPERWRPPPSELAGSAGTSLISANFAKRFFFLFSSDACIQALVVRWDLLFCNIWNLPRAKNYSLNLSWCIFPQLRYSHSI